MGRSLGLISRRYLNCGLQQPNESSLHIGIPLLRRTYRPTKMYACSRYIPSAARMVGSSRSVLRPLGSSVSQYQETTNQQQSLVPLASCSGFGSVFGNLVIGYARNPSLKQQLFSYAILGFALSEAMGLFCLMMAFLILFAF